MDSKPPERGGFTLVELVVVIMILGILAAVGVPRILETSKDAADNGLRHSLATIRDAIENFTTMHDGTLPGSDGNEVTFKNDISSYLRKFPTCPIGEAKNDQIRMMSGSDTVASTIGGTATTQSWAYNYETSEFCVNSTAQSAESGVSYDEF